MTVTLSFLVAACIVLTAVPVGAALPGGSLVPTTIGKYVAPLVIPPAMPRDGKVKIKGGKNIDYYEIAVRQFDQQILPTGFPKTTVWSYGSVQFPGTVDQGGSFNYPAFTIEAKYNKPVRVKWINDLVDAFGNPLPHLLTGTVDQTLHWANPLEDCAYGAPRTDCRSNNPTPYTGPVPMVTHVHGAHVGPESDGYPEAWWLPATADSTVYATRGTLWEQWPGVPLEDGAATYQYPNDQRATTLWYHDHTLGMTRLNVYAGPAGFYLLRGGPSDTVIGTLPGPAPALGDPPGTKYYEIPIVIQDRSFNVDGSLFYPDNRAFFEGLDPAYLDISFIPSSDISPIWNPEAFFNTMVVNGGTWPYLNVEPRRYRFRFLNGCNSRFLILQNDNVMPFYQIGTEGGFLPATVSVNQLLLGPAERADVIMDFTGMAPGTEIILQNLGPDEPFGGGIPGVDFDPADVDTTGQVMKFKVVPMAADSPPDTSTDPMALVLPPLNPLGPADNTRQVSLNEEESIAVCVEALADGSVVQIDSVLPGPSFEADCQAAGGEVFAPKAALLGVLDALGSGQALLWMDDITENPALNSTEVWEIYNFTEDAHPIHLHLVQFQVVDRQPFSGAPYPVEAWETGWKDTVIAYPGEITRIKARFDIEGLYVWHCHIVEHEDNEMMRPYYVGDPAGSPVPVVMP
jgi:FtsP/CotA-like multicopper oxidase with cupredoxin domain